MASGSESHDIVEHRVVRKHLGSLVKQSQFVLTATANELYGRELISTTEHTEAINSSQPTYDRATKIMGSVLTKIQHDSSCFCKLVEALRAAEIESAANDLEASLSEEKACCVISGGLQTNLVGFSGSYGVSSPVLVETPNTTNSSMSQGTKASVPLSADNLHDQKQETLSKEESGFPNSSSFGIDPIEAGSVSMVLSSGAINRAGQETLSSRLRNGPLVEKPFYLLPRYSSPQFSGLSKSSQIVGGETMEFCVKPGNPLKSNPHIDACSELVHRPLRMVRSQRTSSRTSKRLSPLPQEESSYGSDDVFPIQNTEEPSHGSPSRHHFVKEVSVQSSCVCHVKIQFLQRKLTRHMSQIEFLQHELEEIEKNFEEELTCKSEALQKRNQMIAKRDNIIKTLNTEIISKDKLARQLYEEIAEYEEEIDSLHQLQQNAEQKQWIAEEKARLAEAKASIKIKESQAKFYEVEKELEEKEIKVQEYHDKLVKKTRDFEEVKQRAEQYQAKIARLEKELKESKQREDNWKQEFVKISAETVRSEISADIQACVADRNNAACSAWVPKLKILVERERKKAASEDDYDGVKIAGELAERVEHLLRVTETTSQTKRSTKGHGYKGDISALDLETPEKELDYLLW